jgi:hypothetical protein
MKPEKNNQRTPGMGTAALDSSAVKEPPLEFTKEIIPRLLSK